MPFQTLQPETFPSALPVLKFSPVLTDNKAAFPFTAVFLEHLGSERSERMWQQ
jgi:hypothetical protein